MKVISIHKTENRGAKQRVLLEFEADSVPSNGWLQYFTELFTEKIQVSGESTKVEPPVVAQGPVVSAPVPTPKHLTVT